MTNLRVAGFAVLLATSMALAATGERIPGRFDDRVRYLDGGRIGVAAKPPARLDVDDPLRAGWTAFADRYGGGLEILLDERTGLPTVVSGRGIRWFDETTEAIDLQKLDQQARRFLEEHAALLGEWTGIIALDTAASGRLGTAHWQLIYRQRVDGVLVENSRFDFHVKFGRLAMFGASNWGVVATSGTPTVDRDQARAILDEYLDASSSSFPGTAEPELALVAVDADPSGSEARVWGGERGKGLDHVLLWRFRLTEPGGAPNWIAEIDAHDGTVRAFYDATHYQSVRGGVFPLSNDGDCATGGCEVTAFPMPFADYTQDGETVDHADEFGNLVCPDPAGTTETRLAGPYFRVVDACGDLSETATCEDGIDLGLKNGENCAREPGASDGNSAAARTAYYHLNRVAEAARFYDPASPWLSSQVEVKVNQPGTCNAFWSNGIRMLSEGGGCGNTGEQHGVLVHEWGHGYDFNDGGGEDVPSEAYADVVTILASRASCISRGWFNDGRTCSGYGDTCLTCTGVRDHDWAARQGNTPATPVNFTQTCPSGPGGPCGREAHCEAYPIGETIFDLATRDLPASGMDADSAWQLVERLWYATRNGSGGEVFNCLRTQLAHSCFASHWMQRMRVADDDDADLSNGTPHAAEIFAAFDRHGISCGSASDPENQSTSSCPTIAPPTLSLVETPSGTELSWDAVAGANEIRVYRNELGCARQQVVIASLAGNATSFVDGLADPGLPRFYRVEAIGGNPACNSPVSNCRSTPLDARLQQLSYEIVGTGPDANGYPDPGETVAVPVTLFNGGLDTAANPTGTLSLRDPAQGTLIRPDAGWGDIPAGGTAESLTPHFELQIDPTVACGETVELETEVWASNAGPARRRIDFVVGDTTPAGAVDGLAVDLAGGAADIALSWSAATPAAGYHVLWSDDATFASGVTLEAETTGTDHTMIGGTVTTPGLTFFQIRAVNDCGQEGP